ncbi:ABC transporter ATP-binding protein [Alkalihalobacillus sp. AL-G]|uniref:ABC transporter ATP-binding protein n=1 Tax=Alkalihalobacillus sp. AL-G TaxID=2926399 RepID=UPI00272AB6CF|nr:ATP-binding cassette domain-containing protein [Alkalihalobacillus sp. AL-G]WLD92593.1 ATP-binding cassette domain-containing protein [Alkalihalobacillus sp. AL-G]
MKTPLVKVRSLSNYFYEGRKVHRALDGISFDVFKGETLGIVGESGSGKSTLGRTLMRLYKPNHGTIHFDGTDITTMNDKKLRPLKREFQMIFQNLFESLNPRFTVGEILEEPMLIQKLHSPKERTQLAMEMLDKVGLPQSSYEKRIHEFSGGQRQRIAIARALALKPKLIIADEPVSALDVSVQAQILNLLKELQKEYNLTCIFISHDLSVVHHMSDRVAVLHLGHMLEIASKEEIFRNPIHPYTKSLLASIPRTNPYLRDTPQEQVEAPARSPHPPHLVNIGSDHYVAADVIEVKQYEVSTSSAIN